MFSQVPEPLHCRLTMPDRGGGHGRSTISPPGVSGHNSPSERSYGQEPSTVGHSWSRWLGLKRNGQLSQLLGTPSLSLSTPSHPWRGGRRDTVSEWMGGWVKCHYFWQFFSAQHTILLSSDTATHHTAVTISAVSTRRTWVSSTGLYRQREQAHLLTHSLIQYLTHL